MNANRNERLYQRGIVPVRFYGFELLDSPAPFEKATCFRVSFRHPCPCNGWRLDTKSFIAALAFDPADTRPLREQRRQFKSYIRAEAKKHVAEFMALGTVDGKPWQVARA